MTDEERLQKITEMLILVRDNLFRGMSKSIQKLQARSINEVLELPNYTRNYTSSINRTRQNCVLCGDELMSDFTETCYTCNQKE